MKGVTAEENVFTTRLERVSGYEFKVRFDSPRIPEMVMDEPEPLGKGRGPSASRVLSTAVANCLSSSFLFCLGKARIAVNDLKTSVETVVRKNERGRWRVAGMKVTLHPFLKAEDVDKSKRCLGIFQDFCIVTESVRKGIEVKVDVEIRASSQTAGKNQTV